MSKVPRILLISVLLYPTVIFMFSSAYTPAPPDGFVSPMTGGIERNVIERFVRLGSVCRTDVLCPRDIYVQCNLG
jgi:hypothetical protein